MVRASNDVSTFVRANTIQENEKRLVEARIKSQVLRHKEKSQTKRDLSKLFHKLNRVKIRENTAKSAEKSSLPCHNKNATSCWYGPVPGFPSGSWWGIRMDCSRDRVHDPFNADVDEGLFGVASVCTSHTNMNEDVDLGDFLTLTGQVYEEQANMDPFVLNYKNQIPLRLIRSYNLQDNIAPNTGYRYDGLYIVISHWIGVDTDRTKYNKFALMRYVDQEASCWSSRISEVLPSMQHCNPSASLMCLQPCTSSNAYDLRKYSHSTNSIPRKRKLSDRDSNDNQPPTKLIPLVSIKKSVPESSILTRHVFNKPKSTESTLCSASILDQKTLTVLGTSTSKTHSTNISIRMGLYESSHNMQETKKCVSTMLHKPFKPIDISNRTALDTGSVCLPPKEEKSIARINVDKTRTDTQPIETASYEEHVMTNDAALKHGKNLCSLDTHPSKCSHAISSSLKNFQKNESTIECKEQLQDVQRSINMPVQKLDFKKELQRNSVAARVRILKRHDDASEISSESFCMQGTKFVKSLDTLTPDKILNLINKERHHPLSKLLIENVIGLTSEECVTWNTSKAMTSDVSPKTNYDKRDNVKENVACLSEDVLNRRYRRYSKRLPWKTTKQTDIGKFDKVLSRQSHSSAENCNSNGRMEDQNDVSKENTEVLSPFHVQIPLQTTAQHTRSTYDIKTRMRTNKGVVLAKQEFPGSSIKKNRYKKQDREIANLSIDANIAPKTRGPRNRRLRCINNTYTNKRYYNTFNTVMYPPGKRNRITEKQRYKTSFKRKSKLTKISHQHVRDRQANKDRYRVSNTLRVKSDSKDIESSVTKKLDFDGATNTNNDDSNYNNNEINGKRESSIDSADHNITKASFDKSLQKKLTQTMPLSCRALQPSRLHYFRKREIEKPRTMDATTQCRLLFEKPVDESILEKTTGNENTQSTLFERSNQRATVKTNSDRSGKVKSKSIRNARDTCSDRNSRIDETSRFSSAFTPIADEEHYTDNSRCSCKESAEKSLDKMSAFVPVNAFDSDLRIARLRSIGFKPIIKPRSPLVANERIASSDRKDAPTSTSKVTRRNVAEEYEKYTSTEDNNVVYMDDELQYEDIEREEDDESAFRRERVTTSRTKTLTRQTFRRVQSNDDTVLPKALASYDNVESPWHGWKKIETDNRSYWVGW